MEDVTETATCCERLYWSWRDNDQGMDAGRLISGGRPASSILGTCSRRTTEFVRMCPTSPIEAELINGRGGQAADTALRSANDEELLQLDHCGTIEQNNFATERRKGIFDVQISNLHLF